MNKATQIAKITQMVNEHQIKLGPVIGRWADLERGWLHPNCRCRPVFHSEDDFKQKVQSIPPEYFEPATGITDYIIYNRDDAIVIERDADGQPRVEVLPPIKEDE